jgi:hypothetical protein
MTDADAWVAKCQFYIRFRYWGIGYSRHDVKARRYLSEQLGLVISTSVNGDPHPGDALIWLARRTLVAMGG